MQFQVPQNIAMEDRIIGPLTAIQFAILVLGGGAAFFLYTSPSIHSPFNAIIGGVLVILTIIMALGKFNDQPMFRFAKFILAFIVAPKTRIWHKAGTEPNLIRRSSHPDKNQHTRTVKHVSKDELSRLAQVIDSRGRTGTLPVQPPKK